MGSDAQMTSVGDEVIVSIHAPTWGATELYEMYFDFRKFQSTLPHGERPWTIDKTPRRQRFNPRSHMGSDHIAVVLMAGRGCFNPRSHMGSDVSASMMSTTLEVSIHAPTWGATFVDRANARFKVFQSTLPHGERRCFLVCRIHGNRVSIHAPTWGATSPCRRGPWLWCFNPRSHMGSDFSTSTFDPSPRVSIHAPTWGATDNSLNFISNLYVSIHAPTWGATA